jgi:L-fuculose-phosphate aldolase
MSLQEKYKKEVQEFLKICHKLSEKTFVTGYGGNLAWKLEENVILITPTMMHKGDIREEDLVFIDFEGSTIEGYKKPTGERSMYLKFFNGRPDIESVLHCHAPNVCAFAIMGGKNWLMRPFFPETVTEVGPVPVVPYAEPLTDQLAENFSEYLPKYDSFLMENHGLVTMSKKNIEWTFMNVDLLESSAYSILQALSANQGLKEIDRKGVENLSNIMKKRGLDMFGAPGMNESLMDLYYPE